MGYIPYIPPPVHYDSHSNTDPKTGLAIWIACHVLPLLVMLISFVYNKIKGEWTRYDLPPLFEFFGIWLAAALLIDALVLITALVISFL